MSSPGVKVFNHSKLASGGKSRAESTEEDFQALRIAREEVAIPAVFDESYNLLEELAEMEIDAPLPGEESTYDNTAPSNAHRRPTSAEEIELNRQADLPCD